MPSETECQHLQKVGADGLGGTIEDGFTQSEWQDAGEMSLRCEALSVPANTLVDTLLAGLAFADQKQQRPSTLGRRRKALEALLADLLKLHAAGRVGSFGLKRDNLARNVHGFAADVFKDVRDAMIAGGLLHFKGGRQKLRTMPGFGQGPTVHATNGGYVARFKLTDDALSDIEAAGVNLNDWKAHWRRAPSVNRAVLDQFTMPPLVQLRASSGWGESGKTQGDSLEFSMDEPGVQAMVDDLAAHNAFLKAAGVDGIDFLGLRRSFNEGERKDWRWKSGGRFYSVTVKGVGTRYESMGADERLSAIRLAGMPVAEVDMNASQLRLLYALLDTEMPEGLRDDPYSLPGMTEVDRHPVKSVIAQALGKNRARSKHWGKDAVKAYAKEDHGASLDDAFDFLAYQEAVLSAHPILERLGENGVPSVLQLQWVESEVMRLAMTDLRQQGIPSLPVHDSLIVPENAVEAVKAALRQAFGAQVTSMLNSPTSHTAKVKVKARVEEMGVS